MRVIVWTLFPRILLKPLGRFAVLAGEQFYLAVQLLVRRPEPGVLHAKRVEDSLFQIVLPFHSGHGFHDCGTYVNAGVRIHFPRSRLEHDRRFCGNGCHLTYRRTTGPAASADIFALGTAFEWKSARMVKAHPDSQHIFRLVQCHCAVCLFIKHPERTEFRKIFGNGIIQRNLTLLNELRNGHPAKSLGLGALHEHVIHGDRALRSRVRIADAAGLLYTIII